MTSLIEKVRLLSRRWIQCVVSVNPCAAENEWKRGWWSRHYTDRKSEGMDTQSLLIWIEEAISGLNVFDFCVCFVNLL